MRSSNCQSVVWGPLRRCQACRLRVFRTAPLRRRSDLTLGRESRLMVDVLQRPNWYGQPVELGELFILKKDGREATCRLRSHQFGWELRLFIGRDEIVQTQVCRNQDEV